MEYDQRIKGEQNLGDTNNSEFSLAGADKSNSQKILRMESASQWLIEAVKQAGFDLYEKSITILESAIFHMDDA